MKRRIIIILLLAALMLSSCSSNAIHEKASDAPVKSSESAVTSEDISGSEGDADSSSDIRYKFDTETEYVEIDGRFFNCFINRPLRFDEKEIPYEEFLSYKSPYDDYITLFYDDHSGRFDCFDTVVYAIRYACENDIEHLDFPLEYDAALLNNAWEYARITFPNLPLDTGFSHFKTTDDGWYRMQFTKALLDVTNAPETIEAAKEIIDAMPDTCETQAEKAYYLYDWVCQNVVYDSFHAEGKEGKINVAPQSAYGALVEKRAVCDGIAGAIQLLFGMAGIDCGKVDSFDYWGGAGHAWNVAEIDGEIWDLDATWDIHRFYNEKDDTVTEERSPGYYEWFGVERTAKTFDYDINDEVTIMNKYTEKVYTENSPILLAYDIVVSTDPDTYEERIFLNGEEVSDFPTEYILKKAGGGNVVSIKFNDIYSMMHAYSAFTDSSSAFKDSGLGLIQDRGLLSIQVFPSGYFDTEE